MQGEKKLTYLTIGIFIGLNLLNGGLFYYVNFVKLSAKQEEFKKLEEDVKKEEKIQTDRSTLREKNEQMRIKAEIAARRLPEPSFDMMDIFFKEIEMFCQQAKVGYSSISLVAQKEEKAAAGAAKAKSKKLYQSLSAKLEVTGKFYDLVNFMYLLENNTRLMKIDNFTFTPQQKAVGKEKGAVVIPEDTTLALTLQITTFVRTPKEKEASK